MYCFAVVERFQNCTTHPVFSSGVHVRKWWPSINRPLNCTYPNSKRRSSGKAATTQFDR